MASQDWFDKDFYAVLGVSADADAKEIKSTYRKMARKYHPDSNAGDASAEQRFKDIGEAYAVLSDPEQRKQYDAVRAMTRGGARFTSGGAPGGGTGGAGFDDVFSTLFNQGGGTRFSTSGGGFSGRPGEDPDIEDILKMFGQSGAGFPSGSAEYGAPGGRPGGFSGGFRPPRKGRDIHATAGLSFRQAVKGDTVVVNGVGGKPITARIPPGIKDGATIRLPGKGESGPGGAPGDILLKVTVHPHEVFTRDGDNLRIEVPVTFAEAALGDTITVPTLGGDAVKVKLPAGISSGKTLRVKGRGVRRKTGQTGDLLVKVAVTVPQRLTDEARAAVEALKNQEAGIDPREDLFRKARS